MIPPNTNIDELQAFERHHPDALHFILNPDQTRRDRWAWCNNEDINTDTHDDTHCPYTNAEETDLFVDWIIATHDEIKNYSSTGSLRSLWRPA